MTDTPAREGPWKGPLKVAPVVSRQPLMSRSGPCAWSVEDSKFRVIASSLTKESATALVEAVNAERGLREALEKRLANARAQSRIGLWESGYITALEETLATMRAIRAALGKDKE